MPLKYDQHYHPVNFMKITTEERDALDYPDDGTVIFNISNMRNEVLQEGVWVPVTPFNYADQDWFESLTIVDGAIEVPGSGVYIISPESGTADTLTKITGGEVGDRIVLYTGLGDEATIITITSDISATANIVLPNEYPITLALNPQLGEVQAVEFINTPYQYGGEPAWALVGSHFHPLVRTIYGSFYARPESTTVPKLIIGPMDCAGTFVKLTIKSYEVAAESAIRVDLHKQTAANEDSNTSTTVFTTQTNRPTIAAASYAGHTDTFEVSTFADGDWLYFFLDVDDSGITVINFSLKFTPG